MLVRGTGTAAALCWSSHKEIPHAQGKRNPSKMVVVARGHQRADTLKPYSQKTSQSNHTRTTALSNSMKLSHAHGATQDWQVMVERFDRMWSTGQGNGKPLQYSCLENSMNSIKRQKDRTLNKASGGDGIPVELFQILKDDAVKVLHSICQQIWKTQQ